MLHIVRSGHKPFCNICGSGTLSNRLSSAGYTDAYVSTNLGQIWQAPLNGAGSNQQYLYCQSQPHELTGIYPIGTTCANKGSATPVYTASYDAWGNATSRATGGVTATISYDTLNRQVEYNAGSTSQEWYVYDASGNRVLKRSISGSTTTLTGYAYGLQELTYTGTGTLSSQLGYYSLAGHLIGSTNGTTTSYDLTDAQGSVLATFSASAIQGEQNYGPYGNKRYTEGTIGTDKAYTGQFHDAVSGLDYYNARYYDPVAGVFLSPDSKQGNGQGMDPYAYVGGNPTTKTDPTGQRTVCAPNDPTCGGIGGTSTGTGQGGGGSPDPGSGGCNRGSHPESGDGMCVLNSTGKLDCATGMSASNKECVYDNGDCRGLTPGGCTQQRDEAANAKKSLLALWAQRDHDYKIAEGILALVATLLGVLAVIWLKGNALSMVLALIANVIPVLVPLLEEFFTPVGGSTPGWVLELATTLDFFAGIANFLGMAVGFFTGAGILGTIEDDARRVVTGLSIMAFSFFSGGTDVFAVGLAEDDEYRYSLQQVWDPITIIAQCRQQGGAVC